MNRFILFLNSTAATLAVGGGKGARLSEMLRAGFPVPFGYLITTAAYRAFVAANRLDEQMIELVNLAHADDPAALETASEIIRDRFHAGLMPREISQGIIAGYRQLAEWVRSRKSEVQTRYTPIVLNALSVAVRSSATAEDLPTASFAGQHDTYLNVRDEAALLEAVKRCWSSLWTARAIAYRRRHNIEPRAVSQAVVVQSMVAADAAGILFTANPMNGDRAQVVINAVWGLGESVVGGRVTPDTIFIDKATGRVKDVRVATKPVMTVLAENGTQVVPVESRKQQQAVFSEEQAVNLTRLGEALEAQFGAPQDVEWALAGNKFYILQSRPLTTLRFDTMMPRTQSKPAHDKLALAGDDDWPTLGQWSAQPFDLWTLTNLGELWPNPVSPLLASAVPMTVSKALSYSLRGVNPKFLGKIQWAKRFYGRIYFNEGALTHLFSHELGLPASFIDRALGNRRRRHRQHESKFRRLRFLRRLPIVLRLAIRQQSTGRQLETLMPQIDRLVADFRERNDCNLSDRELWAEALAWMEHIQQIKNLQLEMTGLSMTAVATLERLIIHWFGRQDLARDLITGLSGIEAAMIGFDIWQIAQAINKLKLTDWVIANEPEIVLRQLRQSVAAKPVLQMLEAFLQKHGHRCPNEEEWLHPRWADAPEQVIELVAAYLRPDHQLNPVETEAKQRQRREEAVAHVETHLDPLRRSIFRIVLSRAQHAVRLRDNGKSYAIKASFPARRIAALFGERWANRGWLRQPEDFFFLTIPDVQRIIANDNPAAAGLDLFTLAAKRRKAFESWFAIEAPEAIGADGKPMAWRNNNQSEEAVLQGIAVSGGYVRGAARVIHDPRAAMHMQPGEILVTRATDAGWTAIFPLLSGMVTEIGGQLSHAAILAREYGLPAVVDVHDATRLIRDGQIISIDGTTGRIYLDGVEVSH